MLRERQRATLQQAVPSLLDRVEWLDRMPDAVSGTIVANEVLDAMPVERFALRSGEINALGVTWHFGRYEWSETRASEPLRAAVRSLQQQAGDGGADESGGAGDKRFHGCSRIGRTRLFQGVFGVPTYCVDSLPVI